MSHLDDEDDDEPIGTSAKASKPDHSLASQGVKYLCSNITGSSVQPIVEWILEENYRQRHKRLTLFISSYGGECYASFSLISAIRGSRIPVDTVGLGYIASAGLTIFIHGARRTITSDTFILCHQYSGAHFGKEHELVASRKEEDWLGERFVDMYTKRSKLNRRDVKRLLLGPSDTFLTAKEALRYGLADEIRL